MAEKQEFTFDEAAATRAEQFFPRYLRHVEGEFVGQPFELLPWQKKIIRDLFGWKRADGTRRYRTAYIEIPRKNGKSCLAAGIALYLLLCDDEAKAQIYSAAGDRMQARIVFECARDMCRENQSLEKQVELWQHRIVGKRLGSFYQALSAEAYSKHGFNAHGIIFDEMHVQPDRQLWDVLTTSVGARRQPLTVAITTAGVGRESFCWEMHKRARLVQMDPDSDPHFYSTIFSAEPDDDWTDPEVWARANPSLGSTVKLEYLHEKCDSAKANPAEENAFRNLHLNQWTEQYVRSIPMMAWDECGKLPFDMNELRGKPCWVGVDLASTRDVAAAVLVFRAPDDGFYLLPYFWVIEATADERARQDQRHVQDFIRAGLITSNPGPDVHYPTIVKKIMELSRLYKIQELSFDPWNSSGFLQDLMNSGFPEEKLVKFPQTVSNFAESSKRLIDCTISRTLRHGNNSVLRWMANNVQMYKDPSGNLRPDKGKSGDKIDGIVASLMGIACCLRSPKTSSVYETRGILMV